MNDFLDKKNFKSYAELEAKMKRVLGLTGSPAPTASAMDDQAYQSSAKAEPVAESYSAPAAAPKAAPVAEAEEDDSLSFFEKLAEED